MSFFPTPCLTLSLGFAEVFGRKSYPKRPKKNAFFGPEVLFQKSSSCVGKGPNQRNTLCKRGDAVLIKHKVHAGMFNLAIHHTGEVWDGLLDVNLGGAVRVNDRKAPSHCGVPAVDTTAVPAPAAVVLVSVHGLATHQPRTFVGAGWGNA